MLLERTCNLILTTPQSTVGARSLICCCCARYLPTSLLKLSKVRVPLRTSPLISSTDICPFVTTRSLYATDLVCTCRSLLLHMVRSKCMGCRQIIRCLLAYGGTAVCFKRCHCCMQIKQVLQKCLTGAKSFLCKCNAKHCVCRLSIDWKCETCLLLLRVMMLAAHDDLGKGVQ